MIRLSQADLRRAGLHATRAGPILRELVRARAGVHHGARHGGHVVAGADHGRSDVTPACDDEPTTQAQTIMERCLG